MKNPLERFLFLIALLLLCLTVSGLLLRNQEPRVLCANTLTLPTAESDLIDLNNASLEQLDSLPGIGPKLAQNILDYRAAAGGFRDYTELFNVEGIGQGRLSEILPYITIGGHYEDTGCG